MREARLKRKTKNRSNNKLDIRLDYPHLRIEIEFCMAGSLRVVVLSFMFDQNLLSGFRYVRGQNCGYCITLANGLYIPVLPFSRDNISCRDVKRGQNVKAKAEVTCPRPRPRPHIGRPLISQAAMLNKVHKDPEAEIYYSTQSSGYRDPIMEYRQSFDLSVIDNWQPTVLTARPTRLF